MSARRSRVSGFRGTDGPGEEGSPRAGSVLSRILVDLLKLNVAPLAVFQMLKSMCAGQRLASEPQDPVAVPLPTTSVPETRGQSWAWAAGVGREREVGSAWHIGTCLALSSQAFLLLLSRDCSKGWPFGLLSPASTLLPPSRMHIQIR